MKKHSFNQAEVLILGRSEREKNIAWGAFVRICEELGFAIRVTGGNFFTHEFLYGTEEDFDQVLMLTKDSE